MKNSENALPKYRILKTWDNRYVAEYKSTTTGDWFSLSGNYVYSTYITARIDIWFDKRRRRKQATGMRVIWESK